MDDVGGAGMLIRGDIVWLSSKRPEGQSEVTEATYHAMDAEKRTLANAPCPGHGPKPHEAGDSPEPKDADVLGAAELFDRPREVLHSKAPEVGLREH